MPIQGNEVPLSSRMSPRRSEKFDIDALRNLAKSAASMYPKEDVKRILGPDVLHFKNLKIRTKERGLIPFIPNPIQEDYLNAILPDWRHNPVGLRGLREIILKGRQFGLSTLIAGLFFLDTVQTPYTHTVIIAHDAPTTERMFQMVKRMYMNMPPEHRPTTKYDNRRELYFEQLDSSFFVGNAVKDFGRAQTINNLHCSEVPSWPHATDTMEALLEAVPEDGNIFVESTAKGFGNWYEEEWHKSINGDSVFEPRFFCWLDFPEYRIDPEKYKDRHGAYPKAYNKMQDEGLTPEETQLKELYKADEAQLLWRRVKMLTQKKFKQEYPSSPEEAFLISGNPYFDQDYLLYLTKALRHPDFQPMRLEIPAQYPKLRQYKEMLQFWNLPQRGRHYIMGVDTAEGLPNKTGNKRDEHDWDSADVVDAYTFEQVCHFHGRLEPHEYGMVLGELGMFFNMALLCVERNNHGHSVLNTLIHSFGYPEMDETMAGGLYMHEDYDRRVELRQRLPGWPTTTKTKFRALDWLALDLDERSILLNNIDTAGEALRFVHLPGGAAGGEGGSFDDRVTSISLCSAMFHTRPRYPGDPLAGLERGPTENYTEMPQEITVASERGAMRPPIGAY